MLADRSAQFWPLSWVEVQLPQTMDLWLSHSHQTHRGNSQNCSVLQWKKKKKKLFKVKVQCIKKPGRPRQSLVTLCRSTSVKSQPVPASIQAADRRRFTNLRRRSARMQNEMLFMGRFIVSVVLPGLQPPLCGWWRRLTAIKRHRKEPVCNLATTRNRISLRLRYVTFITH